MFSFSVKKKFFLGDPVQPYPTLISSSKASLPSFASLYVLMMQSCYGGFATYLGEIMLF